MNNLTHKLQNSWTNFLSVARGDFQYVSRQRDKAK